jgi:hypothetical protein
LLLHGQLNIVAAALFLSSPSTDLMHPPPPPTKQLNRQTARGKEEGDFQEDRGGKKEREKEMEKKSNS